MLAPGVCTELSRQQTIMKAMGRAMMGTGEGEGDNRAVDAAMAALDNPLLENHGFRSAKVILAFDQEQS